MPAIMVGGVPFLDSSVANTISRIARKARKRGVAVFVTGSSHTVRRALLTHGVRPPFARYRETVARAIADIESDRINPRSARTVSPSNRLKNRRLKAIQHGPGQPQNNPGYTTNERGQSSAHRTKNIGVSTLYAAIIGFGTHGSELASLHSPRAEPRCSIICHARIRAFSKMRGGHEGEQNCARSRTDRDHVDQVSRGHQYHW
jgi:hypothetical protein